MGTSRGWKRNGKKVKRFKRGYLMSEVKEIRIQSPCAGLLNRVKKKIGDGRILSLLDKYLRQEVMEETKTWVPMMGTPQGAVISPLLANLYLHPLEVMMTKTGHKMVRYADDFVILCRSREEYERGISQEIL